MLDMNLNQMLRGNRAYTPRSVEDAEKARDGAHKRSKEMLELRSGIFLGMASFFIGVFVVLDPKMDQTAKAAAATWVGMIIGQVKRIWGRGGD